MIVIVDFGSQTAHLIGRRLTDSGIEVTIIEPKNALSSIKNNPPSGIILSGGPSSVYWPDAPTVDPEIFELGIPVLGICYGWQLMAQLLGGKVESATKEYGPEKLTLTNPQLGIEPGEFSVIVSHGDSVISLPEHFEVLGSTETVQFAVVANYQKKLYGVQFHPEAHHTEHGTELLAFFATQICHEVPQKISIDINKIITTIQETVGDKQIICAVSGGVDSTVAAALMARAVGSQLIPVYIESGLMRSDAQTMVKKVFAHLGVTPVIIQAEAQFMKQLALVTDSEAKRKIIGKLYVELFQAEALKHPNVAFLGQGTIYSDVIESQGTQHAAHIKSHHNVGGLPADMKLKLLEPLRNLYKDQVREVGRQLGLPEMFIRQQPFPGPGFAVRIRGEVTPERLAQVKQADTIVIEECQKAGVYDRLFQCFAVMTGAYSTAVKGDGRSFSEVVAVRAYESPDIMTSRWADLPYEVLSRISLRIVNEVPQISRVVYDISTKPPATMEWE